MDESEGLISLQEAARRLGINSGTLRKMVKRGELRAFRVRSNIIRIDPLDLRRFLRTNQIANEKAADHAGDEARRGVPPGPLTSRRVARREARDADRQPGQPS